MLTVASIGPESTADTNSPVGKPTLPAVAVDRPIWILLLGVDARMADSGRADTMILARLDAQQETLHLLSLPRDTRVQLPDHPIAKLNEAYAYGGTALALRAVSQVAGVEVPYFVQVDLDGFRSVVDLLGGVRVTVERRMLYHDPYQNLSIDLQPGEQWLSGDEALKFVRFRLSDDGHHDDDLTRARRQQMFLQALAKQVLTPSNWPKVPRALVEAAGHVRTNLPGDAHLQAAQQVYQARNGIYAVTLPGETKQENGGWYFTPDRRQVELILASWAGLPLDSGRS